MHREIGVAAAEAGKHFWIEKPVGRDARETGEVAAAWQGKELLRAADGAVAARWALARFYRW